jgi:hypothetical protein
MNETKLDRRKVLAGAGGAAALAALWAAPTGAAKPQASRRMSAQDLRIDVACDGTTFAPFFGSSLADGPRGGSFYVEGRIFPAGTIPSGASTFDPTGPGAIGTWLCRGWFVAYSGRELPLVVSTQEYIFGLFGPSDTVIADQLVSSGLEGGPVTTLRSVVGGTGKYQKVRGQVLQEVIGTNKTILNVVGGNAPNFHFTFDL